MEKLIITIAPTGSVPTRGRNPYAPLNANEIVRDIVACYERGAAIAHIHARDENEQPSQKPEHFKKILDLLDDSKCPIIRQLTTSGRSVKDYEERAAVLKLMPPSASLTTGSSNFADFIYENNPQLIRFLAEKMKKLGIKPELEIFDTGMIQTAIELYKEGLLEQPLQFNFVMGIKGSITPTPKNLLHCLDMLPPKSIWQVSIVGPAHVQMSTIAIALGGNVRVGIEDNIWYERDEKILATNIMLMERIIKIAKAYGRPLATPEQAKSMLGLN